ncbi:class I SAM-dependent methyltransferase [Roseateles puraquae]|uniref:Methyltransferase domain-containing protein n=1 Tax=Roseateles puraquae TaxID=431059 RepID=A0A254N0N0_9BURK|nr:class I SAM-dependent methyltransferase [Roseateles puraquae]MDG0855442.1 class I SAM-dependent methyltransferase [Roseateles puraquae]OWR01846.1 hypothetical protein CDO81_22760 [Roseateles puraquae]
MDAGTHAFYDRYANEGVAAESPRSAMLAQVERLLPVGCSVLDVGAGAGRDVAGMLALGLQAWGVEPHAGMRAQAERLYPTTRGRLADAGLPDLGHPFAVERPQGFDAVVCSAVLMHLAPSDLPAALASMASLLRPRQAAPAVRLLLALPEMAASALAGDRDGDGRRFHNHAPSEVQALLAPLGLRLHSAVVNDAVLVSAATRWHLLAFQDA